MKKILTSFLALALALGALGMTMAAAAEPGSSKDPLVTLSYLEDVFLDAILEKVDARIKPGINVPCGFDKNNMPIGFQVLGPKFSESTLLTIAKCYENTVGGFAVKEF